MNQKRQNLSLRSFGAALAITAQLFVPVAYAEPREVSAISPTGSLVLKLDDKTHSIANSVLRPSPLKSEEHLYHAMVGEADGRIWREYRDRWDFHDLQSQFNPQNARNEKHINAGSLEVGDKAVTEQEYRKGFAMQVLQLRMQAATTNYMKTWKGLKEIRSVERTLHVIQKAQTQTISLAPANTKPNPFLGSIRFGYDIFQDFSKVEYACPALDLGFYHTVFLGTTSRNNPNNPRSFYTQLTVRPSTNSPVPLVRYRFETSAMDLGISQSLNKDLSASLATTQPLRKGTADTSYGVSVAYRF